MRPGRYPVAVLFILVAVFTASAQKGKGVKERKEKPAAVAVAPSAEDEKVKDIVLFLQFMLNTIGAADTPARDKDVLITESFAKVFRDAKVQVEDDLDPERKVITNKDVVAYLKDVDFFFSEVSFEFAINEITSSTLPSGDRFYKVALTRTLTGKFADGKPVSNSQPRFIEINFDPESQDLKIVSIYTNQFNEKEALTSWWNGLSVEWQNIFRARTNVSDSVGIEQIRDMTALEELDLSGNRTIADIGPLAQLAGLKLLNISHTQIIDLSPIRNLTELVEVDLSSTFIHDLTPLRFAGKLERLNLNLTEVSDISVLEKMPALTHLEMAGAPVVSHAPLANLKQLVYLNCKGAGLSDINFLSTLDKLAVLNISRTFVTDLSPLGKASALNTLYIDSTQVSDLTPLGKLRQLRVLSANYTPLADLKALNEVASLERIYCDQSQIKQPQADAFMAANPGVLVIFDSQDLKAWWTALPKPWQTILSREANVGMSPTKEELARVTNISKIDASGQSVVDLEPATRLMKLKVVNVSNTTINDLGPLSKHRDIEVLDISGTRIARLDVVSNFQRLKALYADSTRVEDLSPLVSLKSLEKVYVDHSLVHDIAVKEFMEGNGDCLVVYKTVHLRRWWNSLSPEWKGIFTVDMKGDTTVNREDMHRIISMETLAFRDVPVSDLTPALDEFVRLRKLAFSGTRIGKISPIPALDSLLSLRATISPLRDADAIVRFQKLQTLDLSETAIEDLVPVAALRNLRSLSCAGTQVRKLDALKGLEMLETLDCSNTRVSDLDPVAGLNLKTLKCYNSKISAKEIERFRKRNPECNVIYYR